MHIILAIQTVQEHIGIKYVIFNKLTGCSRKYNIKYLCYCQDCQHKKSTSSKLYSKFSNCCYMLGYLSLKYRCSSSKFHFLLWVEIDRNIFKIQHYELHLQLLCTVCHKTRVKPSYICKSSPKSIGSSGRFPFAASFVHHFGLKKTGF